MKGRLDKTEIEALPAGWVIDENRSLSVPGSSGQRHLLEIARRSAD